MMTQNSQNILLVISKFPPEYSGPGVRIPRIYDWFRDQGENYNLQVLCNGIEQIKSKTYNHNGYNVRRMTAGWAHRLFSFLPHDYKHVLIYQFEFLQTLSALLFSKAYKNIDLLHVAGHSGGTAASLVWAKLKDIPVLMELVTANAPHRQKFFVFFKTPKLKNLTVVALTKDMEEKCLNKGLEKEKIWCRPNPIDTEKFRLVSQQQKLVLRSELTEFSQDKIILSNVAKMMPQKNQLFILETLRHLSEQYVALIGGPLITEGPLYERDKEYVENIRHLIIKYKLQNRVKLVTDFVAAEQYIQASDIYLMPAWNEGFGTPMMEALACGVPVVANKEEAAFQEWVEDGQNGYLCDIRNPKNWAQKIQNLSDMSQEQKLEISQYIHEKAGQEEVYKQYQKIIDRLISVSQ